MPDLFLVIAEWRNNMPRTTAIVIGLFLVVASVSAQDYKYSVAGGGGILSFSGGSFFSFDNEIDYGFQLGHRLGDNWRLDFGYKAFEFSNDTAKDSTSSIGDLSNNSALDFKATRLTMMFHRLLFSPKRRLNLAAGFGGGLLIWKANDPESNTTYRVTGEKGGTADFSATELIVSVSSGLVLRVAPRWAVHLGAGADYLTGAGAEFAGDIKSSRDRWLLSSGAGLSFHFGSSHDAFDSRSDRNSLQQPRMVGKHANDSDMDGVPDAKDQCLNSPRGAIVDAVGCPVDNDHDGVPDGNDDCPGTPIDAQGAVDIYGCPVDADFDGVADYLDACPQNAVGAIVDSSGCPVDSDNDGVPDGLDDCPFTLVDVAVDRHGCIDLSMFSKPMVLNIKYVSGSFEIDPHSKERIKRLAGLLNFVSDIKLEISGYTDNIGTSTANKRLSEKRARRVRDFLENLGIASDRMKTVGRGEVNFIASNQTAEGRARNRRIEITFYK
jgi:OOP family OmpA-OmpF porin